MPEVRYNNAYGVLGTTLDAPAAGTSEAITNLFAVAPNFATLEEGYFIKLCLDANTDDFEIVYLTSYTQGSKNGTITRGAEDATNWPPVTHGTTSTWGQNPAVESLGVQIVDLGLVDLATAMISGPQTLYEMPSGSYLASIRFTDDPDTIAMDHPPTTDSTNVIGVSMAFGTIKSMGWYGLAGVYPTNGGGVISYDTIGMVGIEGSYGPYAALDTGIVDPFAQVLGAATVGPVQACLRVVNQNAGSGHGGYGTAVRVAPIDTWEASTTYAAPLSNTYATPGVLQNCAILANGTIWYNIGTSGASGDSEPDFVSNAGGMVSDGSDIIWSDTSSPPPTMGAVHAVAEIWTPQ